MPRREAAIHTLENRGDDLSETSIEVGLIEAPSTSAPEIDGVYSTPIRIAWARHSHKLCDSPILSDPFMHREVIATCSVSDIDRMIDIVFRINSAFRAKFASINDQALWFQITTERERDLMTKIFAEITKAKAGRPREAKAALDRHSDTIIPLVPHTEETWQRLVDANMRYWGIVQQHKLGLDDTAHLAAVVDASKRDEFRRKALLQDVDDETFVNDPLATAEAIAWIFERLDSANKTDTPDWWLLKLSSDVRWALLRVRSERCETRAEWHSIGKHRDTFHRAVVTKISPPQEIKRLRRALVSVPSPSLASELISTLSPYALERLETEIGEPAKKWAVWEAEVEPSEIVDACDRLLPKLNGAPAKVAAREAVKRIKTAWRTAAGPAAKCIAYPKRSTLAIGEVAEPYGECVDLIREISKTFALDLPVDALKG